MFDGAIYFAESITHAQWFPGTFAISNDTCIKEKTTKTSIWRLKQVSTESGSGNFEIFLFYLCRQIPLIPLVNYFPRNLKIKTLRNSSGKMSRIREIKSLRNAIIKLSRNLSIEISRNAKIKTLTIANINISRSLKSKISRILKIER